MGVLDEWGEAVAGAAGVAGPSVARIGRDGGRGAGFVVRTGLVVTSAHNLRGPTVTVTFADGRTERGEVKAADLEGDLAVVAVDTTGATPIPWEPGDPVLGRPVFALGPARRHGSGRVTAGHVSAVGVAFRGPRGRLVTDAFEHTALVGRGSSGGPVVDSQGSLVGINTHRPAEGLYLAIPANAALSARLDALARGETPRGRRLGVALVPPQVAARLRAAVGLAPRAGVLVREVDPDGPAASGGVQAGDLIVGVGGHAVAGIDELLAAVEAHQGEGPIRLSVVRGADELTLEVSSESRPAAG
jgi:S1-C subfamily serine protease